MLLFTVPLLMAGSLLRNQNLCKNPQINSFSILYIEGQVAQIWISFQKDIIIDFGGEWQLSESFAVSGNKELNWFKMATSLILSTVKFSNDIIVLGYCLFAATVISVAWNVELYGLLFFQWGGISVIWTVCFCNRNQTNDALTWKISLFYLNARWQLIRARGNNLTA